MNSFYPIFPIAIHYIMAGSKLQASLSISISFLSGDCETLSCACRRLHGRTRNYSELRIYRNPLLPFSMICCPSNVQQFLRSVGLPGTPSERVRVWLRRRLRIRAPTVLFAQSQGEMFKTKYMSSK